MELEKDVYIDSGWEVELSANDRWVFVVSSFIEELGQVVRKIEAIRPNEEDAEAVAKELEAKNAKADSAFYCDIDSVEIGKLLPDSSEE